MMDNTFPSYAYLFRINLISSTRMRKNYSSFKSISKFSYYLSNIKMVRKLYIFFFINFFTTEMIFIKCFRLNIIEIVNYIIKFLYWDYR